MPVRTAIARAACSAALGLLLAGVPVLVLQAPFVTRAMVSANYDSSSAGLPLPSALRAAESVRVYATDPAAPPLPAAVDGRPGFDEAAASHLRDVRNVLVVARLVTLASGALLALALALALPARRYRDAAWVLRAGSLGTVAVAAVAAAAGAANFDRFFELFHGLFFAAGTWTFPSGTLLIELFPEPLWAELGMLWAVGVLAGVATALIAAAAVSRLARSAVAQDV